MRIKRLILHNFKSYRDLVLSSFNEGCNVIIGKNGQGKSNIHIALLFLFSDQYSNESASTRREVMNEQVTEGDVIVEVQIDNSDRLLMVDSDEVIIKKSIDKDARVTVKVNEKQMPLQEYY